MRGSIATALWLSLAIAAGGVRADPWPGITGLVATADSAATAGTNPAGSTRFGKRAVEAELLWFNSESTWENGLQGGAEVSSSENSGDTFVPRIAWIEPLGNDFAFSFAVVGAGFSDDLGEWAGRYFVQEYDSLFVSALPSLAYRVNDAWSVAGSLALTYASYHQERAVANIFDPGFGDGKSRIDTDSTELGFGLSVLYEASRQTRWGLVYNSSIDTTQDGKNKLSGLGPRTRQVMEQLGVIGAQVEVESTSPQSLLLGFYHEFPNGHAIALDGAWIGFSDFRLSEIYFNGEGFIESAQEYNDIYALAAAYTWPLAERWMLGIGGMATTQMVDDDKRTMTSRLDAIWSAGIALEWQWKPDYRIAAALSYLDFGDAPVTTDPIPGIGSFSGEYVSRDTFLLQLGLKYGGP